MRSAEKCDCDCILIDLVVSGIIMHNNQRLDRTLSVLFNGAHLFDDESTHAMSDKDRLSLLSQSVTMDNGIYISVFRIVKPELNHKLICKIMDIQDVIRFPNFTPRRIITEGHYSTVLEPTDFR